MGKIRPSDNKANQANANKGTKGVNRQHAQVHGNRGKQLNPNQASEPPRDCRRQFSFKSGSSA